MRIPRSWIAPMANKIASSLLDERLILDDVERAKLAGVIEGIITEELMLEDRLNDEVREMLSKMEAPSGQGSMDYRKLFELTKHKLVKERGLIL